MPECFYEEAHSVLRIREISSKDRTKIQPIKEWAIIKPTNLSKQWKSWFQYPHPEKRLSTWHCVQNSESATRYLWFLWRDVCAGIRWRSNHAMRIMLSKQPQAMYLSSCEQAPQTTINSGYPDKSTCLCLGQPFQNPWYQLPLQTMRWNKNCSCKQRGNNNSKQDWSSCSPYSAWRRWTLLSYHHASKCFDFFKHTPTYYSFRNSADYYRSNYCSNHSFNNHCQFHCQHWCYHCQHWYYHFNSFLGTPYTSRSNQCGPNNHSAQSRFSRLHRNFWCQKKYKSRSHRWF